jgi:hypothetical protein
MNALLLEKLTRFREKRGLETAKILLGQKVKYQYAIVKKKETAAAYWTRFIILELEKSIHHDTPFRPIFPSLRHETRCNKKPRVQEREVK